VTGLLRRVRAIAGYAPNIALFGECVPVDYVSGIHRILRKIAPMILCGTGGTFFIELWRYFVVCLKGLEYVLRLGEEESDCILWEVTSGVRCLSMTVPFS